MLVSPTNLEDCNEGRGGGGGGGSRLHENAVLVRLTATIRLAVVQEELHLLSAVHWKL